MMRLFPVLCRAAILAALVAGLPVMAVPVRCVSSATRTTAAAKGQSPDSLILIFPQIADGGGNRTHLLLTNSSATETFATISFFSNHGAPLPLTIDGTTATTYQVALPAFGSAKIITSGEPLATLSGWASVSTDPPVVISGSAVFQYFIDSVLFAEAAVPGTLPVSSLDFFADEEDGFKTGFALANAGTAKAAGTLTLYRKDGTIFGSSPVSLEPGNHIATFLWQVFGSDAPSGRAELVLASGALAATALRYHTSSLFSTVSVGQPGFAAAGAAALFSPQGGVRNRIVEEIGKAQSTIDIAIYSFTADAIRDALIDARNRGVQIRIIADSSQADGPGSEIAALEGLGFQVRRAAGESGGIMHNKFMIIDDRLLLTGSYNWSASAENINFENAIFLQGSAILRSYASEFELIWTK